MRKGPQELPDADTLPGLLLVLIALSGELPTTSAYRLPYADSYIELVIKRLKRDNLIRSYFRDGLRGLRLTAAAKDLLALNAPDRFRDLFTGDTVTNAPKYSIIHRLRLHRMAEVIVTMFNAGVLVFPWEKPALFGPMPLSDDLSVDQYSYYSSREVKEMGAQAVKIRGSRSTGVLLTESDIFIIYNTGPGQMKWEYKAEMRLKYLLEMELCQSRLPAQFMGAEQAAVVFAADMSQMAQLMGVGEDKRHNYFVLDGGFEHFYYLPSDHRGEILLRLLCDADERAILDGILAKGFDPPRPNWTAENDAMDGESPVLFSYTCDMPRLRRFNAALEKMDWTGTLFCFDFQEEAIRQVCVPNVNIKCIDFDVYERSVFLSPESN